MVGSGVGHGFIFVGDMSEISMATPAEERGAVIGTFYLVNYIGLGGPVIGVGMLSLSYGLLAATRVVAARHRCPLRAAHPVGGRGRERVSRGSSRRLKLIQTTVLGVPRPFHIHQ